MDAFSKQIREAAPNRADAENRRWIYVPYDRLTDAAGPLSECVPQDAGIVMMEALAKARRRPYHKKKLTLILASQRQFALEQAERGVKVAYLFTPGIFADGLQLAQEKFGLGRLTMMEPAEREMRLDVEEATRRDVAIEQVTDAAWLSTPEDFDRVYGAPGHGPPRRQYVMDRFYRSMRQQTGYLMRDGKPLGGQYSFDAENRKPYRGEPSVPHRPQYEPDAVTDEVIALVDREFAGHFGVNFRAGAPMDLPLRLTDIESAWKWTLKHLLPHFGPYEDAMRTEEPDLFHSRMSALINISRLLPKRVVDDVVNAADQGRIPLASAEGFVRQILGWREFMRHMHRVTDGYRNIEAPSEPAASVQHARTSVARKREPDEPARPSALGAAKPLPAVYWGVPSGMRCMDTVVNQVVQEGWSHHITRLMVLSNFATLCGYSPRELTDWFWIAYIDAYDWVVEPNVLGMGTWADGGLTATKPYISGAAYIHRMGNYCAECRFNPKQVIGDDACPFTALYWSFLEQHEPQLGSNARMQMPYATLRRKPAAERAALRKQAQNWIGQIAAVPYNHPES
jgi:deoxyribodipyrimidine photolyase-related protein